MKDKRKTVKTANRDEWKMPFGEFKGTKICNVPAARLLWYHDQGKLYGWVQDYILTNLKDLKAEADRDSVDEILNRHKSEME